MTKPPSHRADSWLPSDERADEPADPVAYENAQHHPGGGHGGGRGGADGGPRRPRGHLAARLLHPDLARRLRGGRLPRGLAHHAQEVRALAVRLPLDRRLDLAELLPSRPDIPVGQRPPRHRRRQPERGVGGGRLHDQLQPHHLCQVPGPLGRHEVDPDRRADAVVRQLPRCSGGEFRRRLVRRRQSHLPLGRLLLDDRRDARQGREGTPLLHRGQRPGRDGRRPVEVGRRLLAAAAGRVARHGPDHRT